MFKEMSANLEVDKLFVREIERKDEKIISISQCEVGDVGCVVWDAALVLTKYLETEDFCHGLGLKNKKIVELGSGTGVVGLMAASYGANVIITDLPEFVPLMELNIVNNEVLFTNPVRARALTWGEEILDTDLYKNIDIVLIADCIYYEESLEPLVKTIQGLCLETTCVYCCYEERNTGNKPELQRKFFSLIKRDFHIEEISSDRQDAHYTSPDIHIIKFTRLKCKT